MLLQYLLLVVMSLLAVGTSADINVTVPDESTCVKNCLGTLPDIAGQDGVMTQFETTVLINEFLGSNYTTLNEVPLLLIGYFNIYYLDTTADRTSDDGVVRVDVRSGKEYPLCLYLCELSANRHRINATAVDEYSSQSLRDGNNALPITSVTQGLPTAMTIGIAVAAALLILFLPIAIKAYLVQIKVGPVIVSTSCFRYTLNDISRFWNITTLRYRRVTVTNDSPHSLEAMVILVKNRTGSAPSLHGNDITADMLGASRGVSLRPTRDRELRNPFADFYVRTNVLVTVASYRNVENGALEGSATNNYSGSSGGFVVHKKNELHCWVGPSHEMEWVISDDDVCIEKDFIPFEPSASFAWEKYVKHLKLVDEKADGVVANAHGDATNLEIGSPIDEN
jgi:hypothetical protein